MLQTNGDSLKSLSEIVDRVREKEPQVVMSGEVRVTDNNHLHSRKCKCASRGPRLANMLLDGSRWTVLWLMG